MIGKIACSSQLALALVTVVVNPRASAAEQAPPASPPFFEALVNAARTSAKSEYKPPTVTLPEFLKEMGYDAYMAIEFKREKSLWHGERGQFEVQFFHPGYIFQEPVRINVLENGEGREIGFSPENFNYDKLKLPQRPPDNLFLTGLRVLHPLNNPAAMDELAVFLGSSYFRVLGAHQQFGSSARGLAVDTAESSGEEFPRFTSFWIEKPGPLAKEIRIFARMDSRRVAGAYAFLIKPGVTTVVEVEGSVFLRDEVKKLGVAPLTSMFLFGENRTSYVPDFRPEVHDADALLVETENHSWEYRPLINPPKAHQTSAFANARGFGLVQRDRNGDHYQDLQAHFEGRPSYWIVPDGDWGAGRVELVEIPSKEERNDNIVAYWVPERKLRPGEEFRFRYQLHAFLTDPDRPPSKLLRVHSTRLQPEKDRRTRFLVDFADGSVASGDPPLIGKVHASKGKLENIVTQKNPMLDGWRVFFDLIAEGEDPVELRLWLEQGEGIVSEIWVYRFVGT